MNAPILETDRLILRDFTENDLEALYEIYRDEEVNTFLPWFPMKTLAEAKALYEAQLAERHKQTAYNYAVCLKKDNYPIGYVCAGREGGFDLGYGLRKEFWHQGIITEAGKAVIAQLKKEGIPFITATHDVNNPRSGNVMKRLGMKYQYSYEEQWMPKNILVTFRLYQLNFDGNDNRVYQKYWDASSVHFIETDL